MAASAPDEKKKTSTIKTLRVSSSTLKYVDLLWFSVSKIKLNVTFKSNLL